MEFEKINIYRLVHIQNISHILDYGVTHKDSINSNPNYTEIGDLSLIDHRASKKVSVDNGILNGTEEVITLGDFVPFNFGVKMPMLYVIQQGGNFVKSPVKPEDIIYSLFGSFNCRF